MMALATWIIAIATIANVLVYWRISQQVKEQIVLTKDQIELTQKMFLESHRPELSVAMEDCKYSETDGLFEGQVTLANHGAATAHEVKLQIRMGSSHGLKDIGPIAIQPRGKIKHQFSFPIGFTTYQSGQTAGNWLNALIEGSYTGIADHKYQYQERQEYDPKLGHFVPVWAK
jgi:hypothetical protein